MSTILVVDDMAMIREPIAAILSQKGYKPVCAVNGREAMSVLANEKPDLILLDVAMPEMDGLTMLRLLRNHPQHKDIPVILLTAVAEKDTVLQAARMGVRDYLLKSHFSLEEMLARVRSKLETPPKNELPADGSVNQPTKSGTENNPEGKAVATAVDTVSTVRSANKLEVKNVQKNRVAALAELRPLVTKEELIRLVNEGLNLKPMANVVQDVLSITGSAYGCAEDVAKAVGKDQALCIRILKIANGSVYSRGRPVNNLKDAVNRIGTQEVRKLVMALDVLQQYAGNISEYVDARLFWEHSIACGLIASAIGRTCRSSNLDDFFLWGLLHDVGRLVFLEHAQDKYQEVFKVSEELDIPLESAETKLMILNHCNILQQALEHWRFTKEFIVPVVNHHQSVETLQRLGPVHMQAAVMIALSNTLAHALLIGTSGNPMIYPCDELAQLLGMNMDVLGELLQGIPIETNELKCSLLAKGQESEWPDFAAQVAASLETPIRPLYPSHQPQLDTHRLFLSRIADTTSSDPPNLGVVYAPDSKNLSSLLSDYQQQETAAGTGPLPTLVIYHKGQVDLANLGWGSRRHIAVKTPVRIKTLVNAINDLIT